MVPSAAVLYSAGQQAGQHGTRAAIQPNSWELCCRQCSHPAGCQSCTWSCRRWWSPSSRRRCTRSTRRCDLLIMLSEARCISYAQVGCRRWCVWLQFVFSVALVQSAGHEDEASAQPECWPAAELIRSKSSGSGRRTSRPMARGDPSLVSWYHMVMMLM